MYNKLNTIRGAWSAMNRLLWPVERTAVLYAYNFSKIKERRSRLAMLLTDVNCFASY